MGAGGIRIIVLPKQKKWSGCLKRYNMKLKK